MRRRTGTKKARRQFTPDEKATILRRHLGAALQDGRTQRGLAQSGAAERARLLAIEAQLPKEDAIIALVSEEHVALKKRSFAGRGACCS